MPEGLGYSNRLYDYLGAIYCLGGLPRGCYVRITSLARALNVAPSTVSIMVRRMSSKGLVEVCPGVGARLTEKGLKELVEHLWKVGVLETLFCKVGLDADTARIVSLAVCDRLPSDVVKRLHDLLGKPRVCPHGKPIPEPGVKPREKLDFCGLPFPPAQPGEERR
ncbi:metal-dependent transcriptional regulator [Stetteria hydrogenophila]